MKIGTKTLEEILNTQKDGMAKVGKAIASQGANPTVTLRANLIEPAAAAAKKATPTPTQTTPPGTSPTPTKSSVTITPSTTVKVGELYENDAGFFYVLDNSNKDKIQVTFYKKDGTVTGEREYSETQFTGTSISKKGTFTELKFVDTIPEANRAGAIKAILDIPEANRAGAIDTISGISSKNPDAQLTFADNTFSKITSGTEQDGTKVSFKATVNSGNLELETSEETLKKGTVATRTTTVTTNDATTGQELSVKKSFDLKNKDGNLQESVISYTSEHSSSDSEVLSLATENVATKTSTSAAAAAAAADAKTAADTAALDVTTDEKRAAAVQAEATATQKESEARTAAAELTA
ncbi:MAG: hypothetical protein Q7K43_05235, partial [Candidatus Woesearchaeota archaeon]|nr:hypothetical protein [Candidatus Woesearchaeota archaeon]